MQENIKIFKIDKKRNKQLKKKLFLLKNIVYLVYLLGKCLKMKVHKIGASNKRLCITFI